MVPCGKSNNRNVIDCDWNLIYISRKSPPEVSITSPSGRRRPIRPPQKQGLKHIDPQRLWELMRKNYFLEFFAFFLEISNQLRVVQGLYVRDSFPVLATPSTCMEGCTRLRIKNSSRLIARLRGWTAEMGKCHFLFSCILDNLLAWKQTGKAAVQKKQEVKVTQLSLKS